MIGTSIMGVPIYLFLSISRCAAVPLQRLRPNLVSCPFGCGSFLAFCYKSQTCLSFLILYTIRITFETKNVDTAMIVKVFISVEF